MNVPLVDLKAQYAAIKPEIDCAIHDVLDEAVFYKGPRVERFEQEFAKYVGARFAVGVANCTDALTLALRALRIGRDDEVIVPAMTFIATAEAVTAVGATPVFVDIDPATANIDINKIPRAITEKTKAIIPVHLAGRAVNMTLLTLVAREHGLAIVEDCAQAAGAAWKCCRVGTWGDIGCFSFYPSKNLGGYGDGGMVTTSDEMLARIVRMTADHGREQKFCHEFAGVSSRLDTLQAAVLAAKLPHLDDWNGARYRSAQLYNERLKDVEGLVLPAIPANPHEHVFHCYVVRVKDRFHVWDALRAKGIETGFHYPAALPFLEAYAYLGYDLDDCPEAWAFSQECLTLPLYPELTIDQIDYVADALKEAVGG